MALAENSMIGTSWVSSTGILLFLFGLSIGLLIGLVLWHNYRKKDSKRYEEFFISSEIERERLNLRISSLEAKETQGAVSHEKVSTPK